MKDQDNTSVFGMIKLGLVLALYAAVSCTVLAAVNHFTAPQIARNQEEKVNASMRIFFPEEGFSFEAAEDFSPSATQGIKIESVILAKKDGKICGGAVQVSGPTYDSATILTGISADGTVRGLQFLSLTDSPGFGLKANDSSYTGKNGKTFCGQFEGMNADEPFKAGENFEAISGATITSAGAANLLNEGSRCLLDYFARHNAEESE